MAAPARKTKWPRGDKKVIDMYLGEARAALAAVAQDAQGGDDAAAAAALGLVSAVLDASPREEAALELRARALLALRRYRDVADMLCDYIPSCGSGDDVATSSSLSSSSPSSSRSSGSGELAAASQVKLLSPGRDSSVVGSGAARFLCCLDVSHLRRRLVACFSKKPNADDKWRYLVLGQACFHLGLMEDAVVLLQNGRRLALAAFRRESVGLSEDSFSPSKTAAANVVSSPTRSRRTSMSGSAAPAAGETESVSKLLAHVKLLVCRRAAAVAALDAGLPAEAVRHFNKVLDTRHGALPHPFAAACLVGRAAAFRAAGRLADSIADCNRALALDPAFIPALRARADVLESIGAVSDCLRDLDHLKLLYDASLRDGRLPGPRWRPQGGIRFAEIAGAHRALTARIQRLRGRIAEGGGGVDYYALLGLQRGCTRAELERAHLLLSLKLKPERSASFAERLELVDEYRDLAAVRDQARMSALFLYRMLQKARTSIMAAVQDEEAAERQRARDAAATAAALAAAAPKQDGQVTRVTEKAVPENVEVAMPTAMAAAIPVSRTRAMKPPFPGVFCRGMVGVGFDMPIPVKREAMSC